MSKSPANSFDYPPVSLRLVDASRFSDAELAFFAQCMGPSETERYQRFARPERQRQFLVGRMLLRFAVGEALQMPPPEIEIVEQAAGAPRLALPGYAGSQPGFSISHSGKWVACAVSCDAPLGLDIEIVNPKRDLLAISQSAFHAKETALLRGLHGADRVTAFYHLWCLREAVFKLFANAGSDVPLPELVDAESAIASSGNGWHGQVFAHPDLSCVLCSGKPLLLLAPLKLDEISATELLSGMHPACGRSGLGTSL